MKDHDGIWVGPATSADDGENLGQAVIVNVHNESLCVGRPCVLHHPSDHHMLNWPTMWRGDRRFMERTCPHGIGHPDPDDLAYQVSVGRGHITVHSCDGCCAPPD